MRPKVDERAALCREFYRALIHALRYVALRYGYAICVHGSLKRDIDLVAIPWRETATNAEALIQALTKTTEHIVGIARERPHDRSPEVKPHGRKAWAIYLSHLDDGPYLDISVMPRLGDARKEDAAPHA